MTPEKCVSTPSGYCEPPPSVAKAGVDVVPSTNGIAAAAAAARQFARIILFPLSLLAAKVTLSLVMTSITLAKQDE